MAESRRSAQRVVAFAGSLRRGSFNRALVEAARGLAPDGMTIVPIEIGDLPFYNADVEGVGDPPAVTAFKTALREADGVLISTPEYNDGIPGVLTNAIGERPSAVRRRASAHARRHAAGARCAARAIRALDCARASGGRGGAGDGGGERRARQVIKPPTNLHQPPFRE